MFEKLELTRMAQALAAHAGSRMAVIARNVSHADTPGYRARDLPDFAATYAADHGGGLRSTRPGHLGAATGAAPEPQPVARPGTESPNGNSVSLETEMVRAAETRQQHDMALAIYRATSGVIRASLGRQG